MTNEEKRTRGQQRLDALRDAHGDLVMLQMVMGLTAGMLDFISPHNLDARRMLRVIGVMTDADWAEGVKRTVAVVEINARPKQAADA